MSLNNFIRTILATVAVVAVATGVLVAVNEQAFSVTSGNRTQPYGGCNEAWQAPHSDGARQCRADGWTVSRHLVLNPHDVVMFTDLHECRYEDGSGQRPRCVWFGDYMGNGHGLSYAEHRGHARYFWVKRPNVNGWVWVWPSFARALEQSAAPDAETRNWRGCVTKDQRIKCAGPS